MALKRCDAGLHFYDPAKNNSCPYCRIQGTSEAGGATTAAGDETIAVEPGGMSAPGGMGAPDTTQSMYDQDETVSIGIGDMTTADYDTDQYVHVPGGLDPDAPTVGGFRKKTRFAPIVGWLVCVDGSERGKDYRIRPGINLVGRSDTSDIVIKGDDTISRVEHAEVEYDPEENAYYLVRKKNPEVRLNGTKVREPKRISAYDVIQFGEMAFLFIPLCSEKFQWSVKD